MSVSTVVITINHPQSQMLAVWLADQLQFGLRRGYLMNPCALSTDDNPTPDRFDVEPIIGIVAHTEGDR